MLLYLNMNKYFSIKHNVVMVPETGNDGQICVMMEG